jgi:phosphoesterase RecJ-like protein
MDFDFLYKSAHDILKRAESVLVVAHRKPDGDAIGSTSALVNWCDREGVSVTPFCADPVPRQYMYMRGAERFTTDPSVFGHGHDVVAVFDSGDLRYAGVQEHMSAMRHSPVVLNFDHHVTNELYGDINIVDPKASSASEIAHRFLTGVGAEINQDIATCLLTGIITDTGNFSNPATTRGSMEAASHLLRRGARVHDISRNIQRNKSVASLRLWGSVLSRLKYNEKLGVASTVIFSKDLGSGVDNEQVEGVSNFLNAYLDAKVILVLKEGENGTVRGSLRSADDVDVSELAKIMGGGGHKKAAGFSVPGRIVESEESVPGRIVESEEGWRVEA